MSDRRPGEIRAERPGGIRAARPDDLEALVAIYNAAVPSGEATADTKPVAPESRRAWLVERAFDRRPVWVHDSGGVVAGWLALDDFYGRPAYAATAEVGVYVAPKRRGEGIGGALLRHAIDGAPGLGVAALLGFVFDHNVASLALFRGAGFADWGLLPRVARMPDGERGLVIVGRRV